MKKIIPIIAIALAAVGAAAFIAVKYAANEQKEIADSPLSEKQRQLLLSEFDTVDLTGKAPLKRVIDNKNPLNLVNYYGDEDVTVLWNSIPENQRPYTVILIIPGHTLLPGAETALNFLEKTAKECEKNSIPYAIQTLNGEISAEERLPISYIEQQFANDKMFYGANCAELYNGVSWRGEVESNNSQYIIDTIQLCVKHGAYFFWTDTNMNYEDGMVLEWFETNEAFYSAFKNNSENICLMNKESYGNPSTYSVMQGLWLAGLVGNWGVASDWWHWQVDGDKKSLFGEYDELVDNEWDMIVNYPENMYVQSMMLVMSCGGTCFKAEAPNFSTSNGGTPVGGFRYGISPLIDRIINGVITIPTRQEVANETLAVIAGKENYNESNYNLSESNLYPSTGKYRILPLIPENIREEDLEFFDKNGITVINSVSGWEEFEKTYSDISADTYFAATADQYYYINNSENTRAVKYAEFAPRVSSCEKIKITANEHTSAIIKETNDSLYFYISNYRTDKKNMVEKMTPEYMDGKRWIEMCRDFLILGDDGSPVGVDDSELRTTVIEIKGSLAGKALKSVWLGKDGKPVTHEEKWDPDSGVLTITVKHNGIAEFTVKTDKSNKKLNIAKKEIIREKPTNGADVEKLRTLTKSLNIKDKSCYNEHSYLLFNAALEKAKVIINSGTAADSTVNEAYRDLKKSYKNLLDMTEYIDALKAFDSSTADEAKTAQFDRLLRECCTALPYVEGRASKLDYAKNYKNKSYSVNAKTRALEKALGDMI